MVRSIVLPNTPGYIPSCIYEYDIFVNKSAYIGSGCPFGCKLYGKEIKYGKGLCPTAEEILATAIQLTVNKFYTENDIAEIIEAIRKISRYFNNDKESMK